MPSQSDVREIGPAGKVSPKRRFDMRDWRHIAEFVIDEFDRRKRKREHRERYWAEIDRQVKMEPANQCKKLPNGQIDPGKLWMSEVELPLQAQALEILDTDSRRMMFAPTWFAAHAELTDAYLDRVDFQSLILGDETEVPSKITQDNADKLVQGFLMDMFRQNDLYTRQGRIDAEAFKYGMGVGRLRMETKSIYIHEARGTRKEKQKIPVLVPCSIKNIYLDEPLPSMHSAQVLGEAHIARDYIKLANLQLAANSGSTDPNDEDGGWMPANVARLEPEKNGYVEVLEWEGDLVVPRKTVANVIIPGAIATVVRGGKDAGGNVSMGVIRFRFRKRPYSSYLLYPYHFEGADDAYPTSPLEKGRPVQIMATDALNRLLDSAALKNAPPVGYDRTDTEFGRNGGPAIHPGAQWATTEDVKVHSDIGGEPSALAQAMTLGINLYGDLLGVLPARIGAQTVSHTTAYAKDAELQRGAARTVNYVDKTGQGPLTRMLYMAYDMGRDALSSREKVSFYIDAYGGFVAITKEQLPERASFEWFGAGGPAEEREKRQNKLQSLQFAMQIDALRAQQQGGRVNLDAAIDQVLREGGWTDIDAITNQATGASAPAAAEPNPGAEAVALQQIGLATAA